MKRFLFGSLRTRLILLVLLALIPALGLTLYSGLEQRQITATQAKEEAMRLARFQDITEHRRAEEALLNAAQQWRTTFDGISDIVCLLDREGRILKCNKAMTNLLRKSFSEILNHTHLEIVHGASMLAEECPVERLREKVTGEELSRRGETILLVEDEESVRRLSVQILKRQGYKVLEASCGDDALVLSKEHKEPIHIMLTDVVMPGMSGRELANQLKALHPKMKVLYMSGYTDNAIVNHGVLDEGINYIQKPFTMNALTRKVREVLGKNLKPTA